MTDSQRFRFGIVSDAHLAPATAEPYTWQNTVDLPHSAELLDAGLQWLASQAIDTLVLLGDLTESADSESFEHVRERSFALGVPVLAVPGNCDVDPVQRTTGSFEQIAGPSLTLAPALISMEGRGIIELIGLMGEASTKRLASQRAMDSSASSPDVRVVLTHYPVLEMEADLIAAGFRHSGDLTDRAVFETGLRNSGSPVVIVHGHLHVHDARISGSLLHLSCGALIEPPHHVSAIDIAFGAHGIEVERRVHVVREDPVERLPVFTPGRQRWVWNGECWWIFADSS